MRRLLSFALTALMIMSMFSVGAFTTTTSAADADTVGKVEAGYTPTGTPINTAEEFASIEADGDYYLNADISIDTINTTVFTGTLDGNGKTVNVTAPMFEYLEGATIKNMTITGTIDFRSSGTDWHVGSIAQEGNNITVDNVANYADIIGYPTAKTIVTTNPYTKQEVTTYDSIYAGGLLGSVYGDLTVTNCDNWGEISALVAGGLVGSCKKVPKAQEDSENKTHYAVKANVLFENCNNFGLVSDDGCYDLIVKEADGTEVNKKQGICGGILAYGLATTFTFKNCTNTNDVLSQNTGSDTGENTTEAHTGSGVAGGIAGRILQSSSEYHCDVLFENCLNEGDVIGWSQIGGIGGWINCGVTAINCRNEGKITSRGNYAAGIIGRPGVDYLSSGYQHYFADCVNNGDVVGHRQYAGGITSYSRDDIKFTRCVNTGTLMAEGVGDGTPHAHGHTVQVAGIIVNIANTADVSYCVNTGNMITNVRGGGIVAQCGSSDNPGGGYNTFTGCLNTGDITVYALENGVVDLDNIPYINDEGKQAYNYYYTPYGSGGILGYSWGSGNVQAPRIVGCGVTGTLTSDFGLVAGLLGYCNSNSAIIQGNYFIGELNGPDECYVPHQVTHSTDYQLEYCVGWIDRQDSSKYMSDNYFYESVVGKYMLYQNNGTEADFNGYDCFITKDDVESGKLAYILTEFCFENYDSNILMFSQNLDGSDGKYPTSPYYYLQDDGSFLYRVVEDGNGGYKNESFKPAESTEETTEDDPGNDQTTTDPGNDQTTTDPGDDQTTADPGDDQTTKAPEDQTTASPDESGSCGSVIGASVALIALALIAPAGVMLKKKDEE